MADGEVKDEINLDKLNARLEELSKLEDGSARLENLNGIEADFAGLNSEDSPEVRDFKDRLEEERKKLSATDEDNGNATSENSYSDVYPYPGRSWEDLNNREKRELVTWELHHGELEKEDSKGHREYLYEQIAEGKLSLASGQDKERVKKLMGNDEGVAKRREELAKTILKNSAVSLEVMGATTGGVVTPDMLQVNDLGLSRAANKFNKRKEKDQTYGLIAKAQEYAIDYKYKGGNPYKNMIEKLREERANTSKWRLLRQHRLAKAEQNLDPTYWDKKAAQHKVLDKGNIQWGDAILHGYYKTRAYFQNRSSNNAAETFSPKYFQKMERAINLRAEDKSYKWFSRDVGKKLAAKWKIMWSRSPETLAKKMAKRGNIKQLDAYLKDHIAGRASQAEAQAENNAMNPQIARKYEYTKDIFNKIESMLGNRKGELVDKRQIEMDAAKAKADKQDLVSYDNVVKRLDAKVSEIKQAYREALDKDPQMQVFRQVYGDKLPENGANCANEIITNKAVLEAMSKAMGCENVDDMLKKMGINEADLAKIKEKLFKKKQTTVGGNGEVKEHGKGLEDVACPEGCKHELRVDENKSRYDLITQDKDGNKREPTAEEIKALVARLQKDGIKEVNLDTVEWSAATLEKVNNAFTEAGIGVKNQDQVNEAIKKKKEQELQDTQGNTRTGWEETTPEVGNEGNPGETPTQNGDKHNEQTPVEQSERQTPTSENGDKPNEQQTQGNKGQNIGMAQVLQSISKTEDLEKMKKQFEIVSQITEGKFDKTGENYLKFITSVHEAFGDTKETKYLCDTAAAKALEADVQDIKDGAQKSGDKQWASDASKWLKEETKAERAKVRADTGQKVTQISQIEELANNPKADLKGYPKYIQQAVINWKAIKTAKDTNGEDLSEKQKSRLRSIVLGQAIEGKQASLVKNGKFDHQAAKNFARSIQGKGGNDR